MKTKLEKAAAIYFDTRANSDSFDVTKAFEAGARWMKDEISNFLIKVDSEPPFCSLKYLSTLFAGFCDEPAMKIEKASNK